MKFRLFSLFVLLFISSVHSFAQKETEIGLVGILEEYPDGGFRFQGGLVIDQKITKRSGFEISLITRSDKVFGNVEYNFSDGRKEYASFTLKEHYLNIPVLYKFHSKIVNIAVGPSMDVFMGWNQISGSPGLVVEEYDTSDRVIFGVMGKISKNFDLGKNLVLEPEIRLNPLNDTRTFIGLGVSLKYRVKKQD